MQYICDLGNIPTEALTEELEKRGYNSYPTEPSISEEKEDGQKKYLVTFHVTGSVDVPVYAVSEDEAIDKAVEEFESNEDYDCGCVYNVERDEWAPDCAEEDDDE